MRTVLSLAPRAFTSLNASVYSLLVSAGGGRRGELVAAVNSERRHVPLARPPRDLPGVQRVRPPLAGTVLRHVLDHRVRPVVRPRRQDLIGDEFAVLHAGVLCRAVLYLLERLVEPRLQGRLLVGVDVAERLVRRPGDRGVLAVPPGGVLVDEVRLVGVVDAVDRVVDRHVHDRHVPAGAGRPELRRIGADDVRHDPVPLQDHVRELPAMTGQELPILQPLQPRAGRPRGLRRSCRSGRARFPDACPCWNYDESSVSTWLGPSDATRDDQGGNTPRRDAPERAETTPRRPVTVSRNLRPRKRNPRASRAGCPNDGEV